MGKRTEPLPVNMNISLGFDGPDRFDQTIRHSSGEWETFYKGQKVVPKWAFRKIERFRPNKPNHPKVYSVMPIDPQNMHENGLTGAVTQYDRVYAVDCNDYKLGEDSIHAACFLVVRFEPLPNKKTEILSDNRIRIMEFKNISAKPENIAWKKLIEGIHQNPENKKLKIAIIVDSDLENIEAYNRREKPIIGTFFLPQNVDLIYATGDISLEIVNKLIRLADKCASMLIKKLLNGEWVDVDFETPTDQPYSHFRLLEAPQKWELDMTILNGLTFPGEIRFGFTAC